MEIITLLLIGIGFSFMLPDGDTELHRPNEDDSMDEEDLTSWSEGDVLVTVEEAFTIGLTPGFGGGEDQAGVDLANTDFVISDEDGENPVNDVALDPMTPHPPYENDIDLSSFDEVLFLSDDGHDVAGSDGRDLLVGGEGDDHVAGENGNDYLFGGNGSDTLWGGGGHDLIVSAMDPHLQDVALRSELVGGEGNDTLIGEGGDLFSGGDGLDYFHVFVDPEEGTGIAHITDFDASNESLLIEVRDESFGGEVDFEVEETDGGLEVRIQGVPVVFLEGVEQSLNLNIYARSAGN